MLRTGDRVEITKLSQRNGRKEIIKYDVKLLSKHEEPKEKVADNFYDIMLKSYTDALKIQENLNGMVDVNRKAITLFIARAKFER